MKELSIKEKAKAYDNVREKIAVRFGSNVADEIFSEYEESEDERIRNAIKEAVITLSDSPLKNKCLAWLEKQGETQGKSALEAAKEEKVDNQNCVKPTDKVEPKFKTGDIIYRSSNSSCPVHSSIDGTLCTVVDVLDEHYILDTNEGKIQESFAWQDYYKLVRQKPVEMSRVEDSLYYYNIHRILEGLKYNDDYGRTAIDAAINWFDSIKNFGYTKWSKEDEELRNLLCGRLIYSNIQEKEKFVMWLGKLTPIEQKSAWSEEDEKKLLCICAWIKDYPRIADFKDEMYTVANNYIDWLKSIKDRVQPQHKQEWSERDELMLGLCIDAASGYYSPEDKQSMKDWLYFLKQRYTWKPSEEQIRWLYCAMDDAEKGSRMKQVLYELLEQLKKLND